MACTFSRAAEPEPAWELVRKPAFSFSIPRTLKKTSVQGFEGMIERYEGEGIKLWFDFGRNPDNQDHWPKGTVYENVKLGEDAARIAIQNRVDPKVNSTSSVALYVKRDADKALGMYTWCDNEQAIALAKKILLTVRLAPREKEK